MIDVQTLLTGDNLTMQLPIARDLRYPLFGLPPIPEGIVTQRDGDTVTVTYNPQEVARFFAALRRLAGSSTSLRN